MSSPFTSPPLSRKPPGFPETPFLKARQEWDTRIGHAVVRAKNWRLAFFLEAFLCLLLLFFLIVQSKKRQVVPILVGLDKETGERVVLGPPSEKSYLPGPLEIKYFLSQFVRFVRAVPTDQVMIKKNWLRAYAFLRKDAARLLNELTNNDSESPLKKIGKRVVSVQPLSVLKIPETDSYQVRWKETVYSDQGQRLDEYTMLGTFLLEFELPKDKKRIQENPLGLFIKNFQWNREL